MGKLAYDRLNYRCVWEQHSKLTEVGTLVLILEQNSCCLGNRAFKTICCVCEISERQFQYKSRH